VVRQPQPCKTYFHGTTRDETTKEIQIIQQADNVISVPAAKTIIEQQPASALLSQTEIPVVVGTEKPLRQLVVEQQHLPITQFVIDHQQSAQQTVLQRQVTPQKNLITTLVQ